MLWLAENDIIKQSELEKRPLLEYWHLLNKKVIETDKLIAESKAAKNGKK